MTENVINSIDSTMVSCVMVTLAVPRRLLYLATSVSAYMKQSHSNKELVVVINGGDTESRQAVTRYLSSLGRSDIRIIECKEKNTLGHFRNVSFEHVRGDVICQWDDDDLYHPDRISRQLTHLASGDYEACYLQEVMQYIPDMQSLFLTSWRATDAGAHPGTLMVKRAVPIHYPTQGENSNLGEDLQIALLLKNRGAVFHIDREPHLFIYVSHGANSWDTGHHQMLATELAISRGLLLRRELELRSGLAGFDFGPEGVKVQGSNGLAFELSPARL